MIRFNTHRRPFVVLLTLLMVVGAGHATTSAEVDSSGAIGPGIEAPILIRATGVSSAQGAFLVTGKGFTPGGAVYIAVHDQWSAKLQATRSITADAAVHGLNGSQDPARGFSRGGAFAEVFRSPCSATVMVRAYDMKTARWSNWLDVDSLGADLASHGPNGSLDPAFGFRPGCSLVR